MNPTDNAGQFPKTSWTLVLRLRDEDETTAGRALDEICRQYQYPLYCYIRRRGFGHHDAQDALQDFFAKVLRLRAFGEADGAKGRLRSFLSTALQRFLVNWQRDHRHREREVSFDAPVSDFDPEERYNRERFTEHDTPERIYDRRWSCELLNRVMQSLEESYAARGRSAVFAAMRPVLLGGGTLRGEDVPVLAASLGITENAVHATRHRLLREYRSLLEKEVLKTVGSHEDVASEIADLFQAFL